MSYRSTPSDPQWYFDVNEIEKQVAEFAKANAIASQSAWNAFIAALTAGQSIAVSRGLLSAVKCNVP